MWQVKRNAWVAVVGLVGWSHTAFADRIMPVLPAGSPWVIERAEYTGEVKDRIARFEARYTIRVISEGWVQVPLAFQGMTITEVELERKAGDAHLMPAGTSYVFAASRKGTYKVRVKGSTMLAQDTQFEGLQLGIPRATFSTMTVFVPRKDVELRPEDQLYVEAQPEALRDGVKLTACLGASDRIDLRWRTKPADPIKVEPVLYGEVSTLVTIEEQLARLISVIDYRMAQGETRELVVHLPAGINVLNVRGAGIDDWRVADEPDAKRLSVTLTFALKDTAYRLIVEGEQPIGEHAADYRLPEVRLSGVKQERGYLAVSREGSIELSAQTAEGISRVDVKELPQPLQAVQGAPAVLAFKYHQHPYQVILALTRHDDHPVLAAIAERGELVTVLSRQGELLTRAAYLITANKKQFLEVALPKGAVLWSCIVDGKSVKPVAGSGKQLLVPLNTLADGATAISVELVYFEHRPELTGVGRLMLQGPVLDVPTTISNWSVLTPRDVKFLRMSGNLERGGAAAGFLDDPFLQVASAAELPAREGMFSGWRKNADAIQLTGKDRPAASAELERSVFLESYDAVGQNDDKRAEAVMANLGRLQETGILPLKIRLPNSGRIYRFNRLMTTQEALELEATFVHLRMPWIPLAGLGALLLPFGGFVASRVRRG
jgi:hypothetical protein